MSAALAVSSTVIGASPDSKKRKRVGESKEQSKKKHRRRDETEEQMKGDARKPVDDEFNSPMSKREKKHRAAEIPIQSHDHVDEDEVDSPRTHEAEASNGSTDVNGVEGEVDKKNGMEGTDNGWLLADPDEPTSFQSIRLSLYLPIPPVSLTSAKSSLLALYFAPLLLTYYAPAGGIVLSYTDAVLSTCPEPDAETITEEETLSRIGEELGSSWAWLTVTLLVFKPEPGDELRGWTNVVSEGFIGLVSYNYFQTAVARNRIPNSWSWSGASGTRSKQRKTPRKGKLNDGSSQATMVNDSQDIAIDQDEETADGTLGTFVDSEGERISDTLPFRVVDVEMVPAHERGRWTLQIDGTLLDEEDEAQVRQEERYRYNNRQGRSRSRSRTPGTPGERMPFMSGGAGPPSRAASVVESP